MVPPSGPALLVLYSMLRSGQRIVLGDWGGIVLLYAVFGLAAMIVLGGPALYLYSRLNWTGFFAFLAGGAVCAAMTYMLAVGREAKPDQLGSFTALGVVEGLLLRLILFGVSRAPAAVPMSPAARSS
jgi:hypothetical protein